MTATKVVNRYHKEPFDVYIGRGSIWGNPFSHLESAKAEVRVETREEAIERYKEWIQTQPHLLEKIHELKGKTLGCFCKPKPCHGDILADLADNTPWGDKDQVEQMIRNKIQIQNIKSLRGKEVILGYTEQDGKVVLLAKDKEGVVYELAKFNS